MERRRVVVPEVLTVHLIPHSHDDVGWIKTVDEYFYGANLKLRSGGVQYTIDTVVSELTEHP
jgi:lysosomal alpha-mannosidase